MQCAPPCRSVQRGSVSKMLACLRCHFVLVMYAANEDECALPVVVVSAAPASKYLVATAFQLMPSSRSGPVKNKARSVQAGTPPEKSSSFTVDEEAAKPAAARPRQCTSVRFHPCCSTIVQSRFAGTASTAALKRQHLLSSAPVALTRQCLSSPCARPASLGAVSLFSFEHLPSGDIPHRHAASPAIMSLYMLGCICRGSGLSCLATAQF